MKTFKLGDLVVIRGYAETFNNATGKVCMLHGHPEGAYINVKFDKPHIFSTGLKIGGFRNRFVHHQDIITRLNLCL